MYPPKVVKVTGHARVVGRLRKFTGHAFLCEMQNFIVLRNDTASLMKYTADRKKIWYIETLNWRLCAHCSHAGHSYVVKPVFHAAM